MNTATPFHQDPHDLPPETPHQEVQRCTRNNPCRMQGCMICPTPTNHVRNLDEELNIDESSSTPSRSPHLYVHPQASHPNPTKQHRTIEKHHQTDPEIN